MSTLIGSYDPVTYNQVPDLCLAITTFAIKEARQAIDKLGQVFVKHKMCSKYGLMMVHRHFSMSSNEILVENTNAAGTLSVSMPWTLSSGIASPSDDALWATYRLQQDMKLLVPTTWAFDEQIPGKLKPFEFLATNQHVDELPPEFVADLYVELKQLGLETVFGLRLLRHNGPAYEITPDGERANVVKFGTAPPEVQKENLTQVVFVIDENGCGKASEYCYSCCNCAHCHTHYDPPPHD